MFFTPKKLRDTDALKKKVEQFSEKLAAANALEDPASKLEALLVAQKEATRYTTDVFIACIDRSSSVGFASGISTLVGGLFGGLGLCLVNPFIGVPVMVGGVIGGVTLLVNDPVGDKVRAAIEKGMGTHLEDLGKILDKAGKDINDLLARQSREIAASEKFGSLYDRFPAIRDTFIKTFNQAFARGELPKPPVPPKPEGGPKLAL